MRKLGKNENLKNDFIRYDHAILRQELGADEARLGDFRLTMIDMLAATSPCTCLMRPSKFRRQTATR